MMQVQKELSINKRYKFPEIIKIVRHKGFILIISVDTANWIVLESDLQLEFFSLLKTYTLGEALSKFNGSPKDYENVIRQLEARSFESTDTVKTEHRKEMHLYLTNACNLQCPHCYMFSGKKTDDELSTEEIECLMSAFRQSGGEGVTLSGGEITLRKDLFQIIYHAHSIGLKVSLLTNGVLWTDAMINSISPLVSKVQISIDGYSESQNAKVRGQGNFEKSLVTLDKFMKNDVRMDVAITPFFDEHLILNYKEYASFAKKLIAKYSSSKLKIKFTGEILDGRDISLSSNDKAIYLKVIEKIYFECFGDISDIPFIKFHRDKRLKTNCSFGNITISSDGDCYFCPAVSELKPFANLRVDNFNQILELSNTAKLKSCVSNLEPCRVCELKYICGGDCRIKFYEEFHTGEIGNINHYPVRSCDMELKKTFYDLMIRTNTRLFQ